MSKLAIIFLLILLPLTVYGIGLLFPYQKGQKYRVVLPVVKGTMGFFACFELTALACTLLKTSFTALTVVFTVLITVLCVFSYCVNFKRIAASLQRIWNRRSLQSLIFVPVILLILIQMGIAALGMHLDQDDAFFVATAVTSVETDSLFQYSSYTGGLLESLPARYVFSPFFLLYGVFGKLLNLPPAVIAHTVLPLLLIALCYCVYWLWARYLFPKYKNSQAFFLFFVCLLHMWGYYSIYSSSTFLLIRVWQGKALLASTLLPFILLLLLRFWKNDQAMGSWMMILCTVLACCLTSSMGVALIPIMIAIVLVLYAARYRSLKGSLSLLLCCVPCILIGIAYLLMRTQEAGL